MVLPKNIRYLRKSRGWSQDHLAELLGYKSYTTIQKWETGVSEPPLKKAHALADVFGVDIDVLTTVDMENQASELRQASPVPPGFRPMPELVQVPRLGRIACGTPIEAVENYDGVDTVPSYVKADFTLVCQGDSMKNARIYDGDIVCIRKQPTVENGEIAAVLVDGEAATLKRVHLYPDHIVLEPENPDYKPLSFWDDDMNKVRILGKATHFISSVR